MTSKQKLYIHPKRHLFGMAFYFLFVAIGRYLSSDALEWDDAEQILHSQFLLFGYGPQPPLYDWITHFLLRATGPAALPLLVFKAVLLYAIFYAAYIAISTLTARQDLGILGAYAVFTPAQLVWEAQRTLTHTVLATACIAIAISLMIKIICDPKPDKSVSVIRYIFLGLVCGAGLLAKYSTGLVFLFILIATYSQHILRYQVFQSLLWGSLAVSILLALPHGLWFVDNYAVATDATLVKLSKTQGTNIVENFFLGLVNFVKSILGFFALPLMIGGLLYLLSKLSEKSSTNPEPIWINGTLSITVWTAFKKAAIVYLGLFVVFVLTLIIGLGTTEFKDRWITPFLFFAVPILTVIFANTRYRLISATNIILVILWILGIIFIFRPVLTGLINHPSYLNLPAKELAHSLSPHLKAGSVLIVQDNRLAGSLKLHLPKEVTVLYADAPVNRLLTLNSCRVGIISIAEQHDVIMSFSSQALTLAKKILEMPTADTLTNERASDVAALGSNVIQNSVHARLRYSSRDIRMDFAFFEKASCH